MDYRKDTRSNLLVRLDQVGKELDFINFDESPELSQDRARQLIRARKTIYTALNELNEVYRKEHPGRCLCRQCIPGSPTIITMESQS
jgi:hypothetical protein